MKRRMLKKILVILITLILMLIATNMEVKAVTDSYNIGIITNKSTIEKGDSLEITLSLNDINVADGLGAYQATLEYDKNIFEYVSIEGLNSWDTPIYNNGTFVTTTKTGENIKSGEYVAKITLKVKDNISGENTTIKIVNITASTGTETISAKDVSKNISIKGTNNTTENENLSITDDNNDKTSNKIQQNTIVSSNNTESKTTAKKIIPKAGVSQTIVCGTIGFIIVAIILGIFVYKNEKIFK